MTDFRFKEKLSVSGVEMPRENELSIGFPAPRHVAQQFCHFHTALQK